MEDSIIHSPQTRSSRLREILVGTTNPRPLFMISDVYNAVEDSVTHTTRLSVRDSFEKIVQRPAFWYIPRSEDIARILTAAQHVHLSRVKKGQKHASDPITIITVGDGYGDIPALILAAARRQRLRVTCQVVGSYASTMQTQKGLYRSVKGLSFFCESQLQMLLRVWGDQPDIISEISTLAQCIARSKESLDDLHRLSQVYVTNFIARNISLTGVEKYVHVLKEDFGVQFPSNFVIRSGTVYQLFVEGVQFTQHMPLLDFMGKKYSEMWNKEFARIEEFLIGSYEYKVDMVLQTSLSLDYGVSTYVRLLRAGIVGCIFDCQKQKSLHKNTSGVENVSFNLVSDTALGEQYTPACAWKGVSTLELTEDRVCDEDIFAAFSHSGYASELSKKQSRHYPQPVFLLHGCAHLLNSDVVHTVVSSAKSFGIFGWEKSPMLKGVSCSLVASLQGVSHYSVKNIKKIVNS